MTRQLAWEKWYDQVENEQIIINELEQEVKPEDAEYPVENTGFPTDMFFMQKKISTPFGVYEASDPMCPTNLFDCWIGHTNFPICPKEYLILNEKVPGIGAFKVISKYRFFIGIEKLFEFTAVRKEIEVKICDTDNDVLNFGVY
jgi:hypothetical protein